jgi:AraC-like DNA-binding protein
VNLSRHGTQPEGSSSSFPGSSSELSQNEFCSWEKLALASQFRIRELARICHVSVRTLQRHFQKHYDLTVSQWLHECRLEHARLQLATAESIKAVAYALGYKCPSHFTRDFKEHFGVPPSLWMLEKTAARSVAGAADLLPHSGDCEMDDLFAAQQIIALRSSRN